MISKSILFAGLASQAAAECARSVLETTAAAYLTAVTAGKSAFPELATDATYLENNATVDIAKGILANPITVDLNRTFHDTDQCGSFIEINAASNKHPYVILSRLYVTDSKISAIEQVVTDDGDWAFNAAGHLAADKQEKWDPIPEGKEDTRAVLKAAADAYLDSWADGTVSPPFGTPCSRIEGGSATGGPNSKTNSCKMPQFPNGFKITTRKYLIDPAYGAVDILNNFPFIDKAKPAGTTSTNIYRIEGGKIRYIHELTVCTNKGCNK